MGYLKKTETLRLRPQATSSINLTPYKAMTYNISAASHQRCQSLQKSQKS